MNNSNKCSIVLLDEAAKSFSSQNTKHKKKKTNLEDRYAYGFEKLQERYLERTAAQFILTATFLLPVEYLRYDIYLCMFVTTKIIKSSVSIIRWILRTTLRSPTPEMVACLIR